MKIRIVVLCNRCWERIGEFEDVPSDVNFIHVEPCKHCAAQQPACPQCGGDDPLRAVPKIG